MAEVEIVVEVNGAARSLLVEPGETLLDALRARLGLTGTKRGCDEGECGACTVLVDGTAVSSCIYPAVKAHARSVLTVEGLGDAGDLQPLQQAFIDKGAVQCGFCTPGMLLAAKALLDANPEPDVDEIRTALSGNLCRCTGYSKIIEAVQSVVKGRAQSVEAPRPETSLGHVGASIPRRDAVPKVTGAAGYAADLSFPGMLHAKVLRSPHPHALLKRVDCSQALAVEGVVATVGAADVPGRNSFGIVVKDQPFLADTKVQFVGQAVAAVAATTPRLAEAALRLVAVEYAPLPAVFDPIEALGPEAPSCSRKGTSGLED
ncbi:MAG: 2Fe-2S iron-sulfur cluster-binding protein [Thermoleophilia bacterium]|nr:2Fe-2S iron-sulfur cluster-binding protein [Thermoleophilia bacterium]